MYEKLKSFVTNTTTYLAILLIITNLTAFGLGRSSVLQMNFFPSANLIKAVELMDVSSSTHIGMSENIIASKNGTKYYFTNCSGSTRIKEENRVYFDTADLAKAAGFNLASNCYQ